MKNNMLVIVFVAILVGGGLGFFVGMRYQKSTRPFAAQGQFSGARGMMRGGGVVGDVLSIDKNTMTVKLPDGSSKIVIITTTTSINKSAEGSTSDITVGTKVAAFGTTNSDGSVTATNIQLNPIARGPNGPNNSTDSANKN